MTTKTKVKKTSKKPTKQTEQELDSVYFLKLVMYVLIGSQWLYIGDGANTYRLAFPVGLVFGVAFAMHDHFRLDRKIEYAVLLMAMFVGYYAQIGLTT